MRRCIGLPGRVRDEAGRLPGSPVSCTERLGCLVCVAMLLSDYYDLAGRHAIIASLHMIEHDGYSGKMAYFNEVRKGRACRSQSMATARVATTIHVKRTEGVV